MTARKMKQLLGWTLKVGSVIVGGYLIIIVFGINPLKQIAFLATNTTGLVRIGKIALQILKLMFGITYTLFGTVLLQQLGDSLIKKNK